jgi:uncharacterized membrane protein (Fun14 family)
LLDASGTITTIMSVFEELRPFVGLCQACGMIPYSMEHEVINNKFIGFTLSFNRLVTWWFCLIFILQLLCTGVLIQVSTSLTQEIITDRDIPMLLTIVVGITSFFHLVQWFLSRWVVFIHYSKLRNVVEIVQEVERLFQEKFIAHHMRSSIMLRFIIGFILVNAMVSINAIVVKFCHLALKSFLNKRYKLIEFIKKFYTITDP